MALLDYSGQTTDELLALEGKYEPYAVIFALEDALMEKLERAVGQEMCEGPGFDIFVTQILDMAARRPMKGPLTEEELIILAIVSLKRQVWNGGYDQMFVNRMEFTPILVQACERIDRPDVAAVTRQAVEALGFDPGDTRGRPHLEELGDAIRKTNNERRDKLGQCDDRFYAIATTTGDPEAQDILDVSLWNFIKKNRDKIKVP